MRFLGKLKGKRGFTLAELMIVVAILAILVGIAFMFINPKDISYVEYNRSAEAIATAVQNHLTEIRNSGDMEKLRKLGEQAGSSGGASSTSATDGGYRYAFNYDIQDGEIVSNGDILYLLPFGAIEYELSSHYYAVGFQSDTGMVGEVFYSSKPFADRSVDYLIKLQGDAEMRKTAEVGYYQGSVDTSEIAFANLPTPQLTIVNYEELVLRIYLPEVKQLETYGKELGILVSLSDEDGNAFSEHNLTLKQTAIYSTYSLGGSSDGSDGVGPAIVSQKIASGSTYTIVLDTLKECAPLSMQNRISLSDAEPDQPSGQSPMGLFEDWAKRSAAFDSGDFLLGDNSVITVTVYCLYGEGDEKYDKDFPVDPTFMPRSASVTFNGWFNHYGNSTVDIACGRHLQNLEKLTEMRSNLVPYLPKYEYKNGVYTYGNYDYGMASAYTYSNSHGNPATSQSDIAEKYDYRDHVKHIKKANQINAIDFDCDEWKDKDGNPIPFTPINLPEDFYYYGNYLTINHLYVDAPFYAGLFGYAYQPYFYDILLVNPSVTSQMPAHLSELYEMGVGALIGTSRDSHHINNCQAYMTQENGSYHPEKYRVTGECYVGGLIGFCEDEDIANCSASVYTGYRRGAEKTVVTQTATGAETTALVPVSSKYVGGLIGCITGDGSIEDCYAAGNLTGTYVGGLLGYITEDSDPSGDEYRIESCYTAGHIEYAVVSAAGILGTTGGYGGNPKAALSINKNYCVVIYGENNGSGYVWDSAAPIYGTFEGDGFEWIQTKDISYGDDYLKGTYAGFTFFAGASFESINRNYYIAQRGIEYKSSPYFTSMSDTVGDILDDIKNTTNKTSLLGKIEEAIDKVVWLKKLQTLEKMKTLMERIIYEVENETGVDADGRPYNWGGYYQHGTDFYLDTTRARVEGVNNESGHAYTSALTVVQALHAMYNGKYTDNAGNEHTVKMLYEGSDGNKQKLHTVYNFENYTFMDYYNFLQTEYNTLISDSSTEAEKTKARQALVDVFGDNTKETYETVDYEGKPVTRYFYQAGAFYQCFYSDLLYRLFDKGKDYYQTDKKDNTGELIYRYFRDLVSDNFCELLCDLGMSPVERDKMLEKVKQDNVQKAIDAMKDYPDITAKWDGPMKSYAAEAKKYASDAKTKLEDLLKVLQGGSYTTEEIQPYITDANDNLTLLYDLLDKHKAGNDGANEADWDAVDSAGTKGDMRALRDPIAQFRANVALCVATANSGVENALKILQIKLNKDMDLTAAVDEFVKSVNTYLGVEWGISDSGYKLYNSEQLRNAARGYINPTVENSARDEHSLGFMYDYGNPHDQNPYYGKVPDNSYVDLDNKIYNNVFPYLENEYTGYYPFPFVYGRKVEAGEQATYVLFHYGDWLTNDLWANDDPAAALLDVISAQMEAMAQGLTDVKNEVANSGSTGQIDNKITALAAAFTNCKTTVEGYIAQAAGGTVSQGNLQAIQNTISGWLDTNGAFSELENLCDKHKKDISQDVIDRLGEYREQLQALVDEIKKLIQ